MSTQHTPGPWSVEDPIDGQLSIVEANKPTYEWKFIASIYLRQGNDPDEFPHLVSEANARLIAAAPELLAALKAMDEALCNGFDTSEHRQFGRKALIAARVAIAKATGES